MFYMQYSKRQVGHRKRKEPFLSPSEVCTRQIFRLATTYNAKMRLRASATRDNATHLRPCSTTVQRDNHVQRQHDTQLPCDNMTRNYHVQRQHETQQKFVATNFCQHLPKWIEYLCIIKISWDCSKRPWHLLYLYVAIVQTFYSNFDENMRTTEGLNR